MEEGEVKTVQFSCLILWYKTSEIGVPIANFSEKAAGPTTRLTLMGLYIDTVGIGRFS